MQASKQSNNIHSLFLHSSWPLGNLGGVMFHALFVRIVVHPGDIYKKHCSSLHCSHETLFNPHKRKMKHDHAFEYCYGSPTSISKLLFHDEVYVVLAHLQKIMAKPN